MMESSVFLQRRKIEKLEKEEGSAPTHQKQVPSVRNVQSKCTADDYSVTEAQESNLSWFRGLRRLIVFAFVLAELPP